MKATVFTKNDCVWCDRLKLALRSWGIPYLERNISENESALDDAIAMQFKTMPQLFIDGKLIGGHQDALLWHDQITPLDNAQA